MALALSSPAFQQGGEVPQRYTCEGPDEAPELRWSGAPAGTRTFALIVDDPDAPDPRAPKMTWVHQVAFNIPASATGLPADILKLPQRGYLRTGWFADVVVFDPAHFRDRALAREKLARVGLQNLLAFVQSELH